MKKILLLVQDWISFYNQAEALAGGIRETGNECQMIRLEEAAKMSDEEYRGTKAEVVVGVGSWHSFSEFVERPRSLGFKVLPWIVSDDKVESHIDEYNQLDLILTPSKYCQKVFVRDGIKEEKVKIMAEAVDDDFWRGDLTKETEKYLELMTIRSTFPILAKHDLKEIKRKRIPILLTIGGDATSKGAQEVIQALARIDKTIDWLYVIKTWPRLHTFKWGVEEFELLKKYDLEDRVRYIVADFCQEFVRGLFLISDIYVAPSRSEGFGLPFVQAQMCGKPVVGIRALSVQEVVRDGETGLLAKAIRKDGLIIAEVSDLSRCIKKLLVDKKLREDMGRKGRGYAKTNYSPKVIAEKLLSFID